LARIQRYAAGRLVPKRRTDTFTILLGQFSSPIVLLLVACESPKDATLDQLSLSMAASTATVVMQRVVS
jgi:hypothetical protein